jgi:hypothetical protein
MGKTRAGLIQSTPTKESAMPRHLRVLAVARDGRPALAAALSLLLAALFALAPRPALAADPVVPHVKNAATPTGGVEKLTLTEAWRHGGEDDEDVLFGLVTDLAVGPDGNIYLLDAQMMDIKVFSPAGKLLRTIGRRGEGPGEFQGAQQIVFRPDGTVGVAQVFPGKLVGLKTDGTPAKDFEPGKGDPTKGGFFVLINAFSGGGNLILSGIDMNFDQATMTQKRHYFVRSYAPDGTQKTEFLNADRTWVFNDSFKFTEADNDFVWRRLGVDDKGRVVAAPAPYEYALNVYSPDGRLERVIERPYETWTRDARVKQRYQSIMESQARQFPNRPTPAIETQEPDIQDVRCAADGSIWVLTSRAVYTPEAGVLAAWDVFSPTGEYVKQVKAYGPGNPAADWLFMTDNGLAIKITGFWDAALAAMGGEDADSAGSAMEIVCYKTK